MYFTQTQLKKATTALSEARQTDLCHEPRRDANGSATWRNTAKDLDVPYGEHGSAFLEIDPETLDVRCGLCAGSTQHEATPKTAVEKKHGTGMRTHFVSK
jgi:hypothetical protein